MKWATFLWIPVNWTQALAIFIQITEPVDLIILRACLTTLLNVIGYVIQKWRMNERLAGRYVERIYHATWRNVFNNFLEIPKKVRKILAQPMSWSTFQRQRSIERNNLEKFIRIRTVAQVKYFKFYCSSTPQKSYFCVLSKQNRTETAIPIE